MSRAASGRFDLLKCVKPYMVNGEMPVRCGGCSECRVFAKLEAVVRAQLELGATEARGLETSVVTLTYSPASMPAKGDVSRRDVRLFRMRVHEAMRRKFGVRVRMWGCAEYGERTFRPHYHLILYGVNPLDAAHCEAVRSAWRRDGESMGHVHIDHAARSGVMEYIAGYCVKKWNRPCDELKGHAPEFVVWPQRPPLGGALADSMVDALDTPAGRAVVERLGQDVPGSIRRGSRLVALPRTLRRRARKLMGLDEPGPAAVRKLYQRARGDVAVRTFDGNWYDADAHVDEAGIEQARARRRFWGAGQRRRSL